MVASIGCSLAASGCTFDPGHDYSVVVSWLLNGDVPSEDRCTELGVDTVRLTMDGPGKPVEIEGDCAETLVLSDGLDYGAFVTTVSFDYGVGYDYSVDLLDARGEVAYGYDGYVDAYYGDLNPFELPTIDVFKPRGGLAKFTAAWVFQGGGPSTLADDCKAAGISAVVLWIASAAAPSFSEAVVLDEAPCEDGVLSSTEPVLASGEFLVKYAALDDRGAPAEEGEPFSVGVHEARTVDFPRQSFRALAK
jgi:hypothetical protein